MAANAMEPLFAVKPIPKKVKDAAQLPPRTEPDALGVPNNCVLGECINDGLRDLCRRHRYAPQSEAAFNLLRRFRLSD